MLRIVLTGGPGAGKSVIARAICQQHPHRFALVAEAATQVYTSLNTRWDRLSTTQRRDAQRQIYQVQVKQEEQVANQFPHHHLLLDRGTIDGATYWPDGPSAYWADVGSSLPAELARYHHVLWLQTAAALGIYDGARTNDRRFEDAPAAILAGEKLLELWGQHPNLTRINAYPTVDEKLTAVMQAIDAYTQHAGR